MLVKSGAGFFQVDLHRPCPGDTGALMKAGGRIDIAGCADRDKQVTVLQGPRNLRHIEGHLSKPDDVRPQIAGLPTTLAAYCRGQVTPDIEDALADLAAHAQQLPVHVQHVATAGPFMQVVDVLGDDQHVSGKFMLQAGQSGVCRVGPDGRSQQLTAALVVKAVDLLRVAQKTFRRGDVLNAVVFP